MLGFSWVLSVVLALVGLALAVTSVIAVPSPQTDGVEAFFRGGYSAGAAFFAIMLSIPLGATSGALVSTSHRQRGVGGLILAATAIVTAGAALVLLIR